jgi:hypothetical protein
MRSFACLLAAGVWLGWVGFAAADDKSSCSSHGTNIDFYDSPSLAARAALKAEKLIFVLHVSGHFEDPGLT